MNDNCTFTIQLRGQVSQAEISAMSPVAGLVVARAAPDSTSFTISTDQSGLIGLLRYLHGLGYIILSMTRAEQADLEDKDRR